MLIHVADKINSTTKTINEAGEIFAADHIHLDHKTQGSTISTTMKHKIQTMFQMWKSVWPESSTILSGKRQKLFKMRKTRTFCKSLPFYKRELPRLYRVLEKEKEVIEKMCTLKSTDLQAEFERELKFLQSAVAIQDDDNTDIAVHSAKAIHAIDEMQQEVQQMRDTIQ